MFATYFALVKTKKEKLWLERYNSLRDIVECLEIIESNYAASHMDSMGLPVMSENEKKKLSKQLFGAKSRLSSKIAKVQLLFKKTDISSLLEAQVELNASFLALWSLHPDSHPLQDLLEDVYNRSGKLLDETIKLGQNKCL
jgi:hypothetical protein